MSGMQDLLRRIEIAAVRGWPAFETHDVDGWLVRLSSGGSTRANTVAALHYAGHDLEDSIDRVVAHYRAKGATPRFTISDESAPASLDAALARRGWTRSGDHVTMAKKVRADEKKIRAAVERAASKVGWGA